MVHEVKCLDGTLKKMKMWAVRAQQNSQQCNRFTLAVDEYLTKFFTQATCSFMLTMSVHVHLPNQGIDLIPCGYR